MAWVKKGSIRGPKGDRGAAGAQGPAGPKGETGPKGADGVTWRAKKTAGEFYKGSDAPSSSAVGKFDGYLHATRVYNAVWNDYAELFECAEHIAPGRVAYVGDDGLVRASGDPSRAVGVVSDRYGHLIGGDGDPEDGRYVAVALAGRVPVEVEGAASVGDMLAATGRGTARAACPADRGRVVGKLVGPDPDGRDGFANMLAGVS